jgi:DNA-binding response OmpR family regulator
MKKILLIEDDTDLFSLLKYNLEKEGFFLTGLQTGKGALELCRQVRPDLILLDIMLPDSDGLDICKGIRKDSELASTPVIFLTARGAPWTQATPARVLEAGGVELDPSSRQVRLHGEPLSLTATEFRLLEFLMNRPGVVFSREQLLNAVWGQDRAITDRAVDVYVLRLRQKVEEDPASPILIHSVRGFGYTFEPRRAMATA